MEYWAPCKPSQCSSADILFLFFSIFHCVSLRHILVLSHQRFLLFLACFDTFITMESEKETRGRREAAGLSTLGHHVDETKSDNERGFVLCWSHFGCC